MPDFFLLLLAVLLVLLNAFFVAAEFAIVKLRMTQAEELARTAGVFGRVLRTVRSQLDAYLSACQLGITLASLGLGWIGEPAVAAVLAPPMHALGIGNPELVHGVSFALAFTAISFVHIVVGELAPKSIAIRQPAATALWLATPLFVFYWISYPFIWVLNRSAGLLLRLVGLDRGDSGDEAHSVAELKEVLLASHRHGELGAREADVLGRALEFSELTVADLMRPATGMVMLDAAAPFADTLALIRRHRFSRYPVYQGERDRLIGLLHIKDLFVAEHEQPPMTAIGPLLRELPSTPRTTPAMTLFRRFRRGYPHFAIVTDEDGSLLGFVTLDHLLEALHGRIRDEFQHPRDTWKKLPDGSYEGSGGYSIYSLERLLGHDLPEAEELASISGLVMRRLDRVAQRGDHLSFKSFDLSVTETRGPRISRVRVVPRKAPPPDDD